MYKIGLTSSQRQKMLGEELGEACPTYTSGRFGNAIVLGKATLSWGDTNWIPLGRWLQFENCKSTTAFQHISHWLFRWKISTPIPYIKKSGKILCSLTEPPCRCHSREVQWREKTWLANDLQLNYVIQLHS